MLRILEANRTKLFHYQNSFCAEAKLIHFDSLINYSPVHHDGKLREYKYAKACALVEVGKPDEAIRILQDLSSVYVPDYEEVSRIQNELGVAYLRLGEQNNCINNHSADACIFPIKGMGVHQNKQGSRLAAEVYQKIYGRNQGNLEARWLINIAYMTMGEYPDSIPQEMLIPGLDVKDSTGSIKPFKDIAPGLNLDLNTVAGGVIVEDFDNDGFLDIVTSGWGIHDKISYFRNLGDGKFQDLSTASRLNKFTGGLNLMQTDYNNDGLKDIFVLRGAWHRGRFGEQPNSLLRNNGDGTFTDVTIETGLLSFHPTQTATWNDFNNDGWLDVFIGNESTKLEGETQHPCELFMNKGDGTFIESAVDAKCNLVSYIKGVTSGDYDNDGWQDIFVTTMSGEMFLLKNKGKKGKKTIFENVTNKAFGENGGNRNFATWFWDYDNDGWPDLFVGNYSFEESLAYYAAAEYIHKNVGNTGQASLYRNNHDGTFSNKTKEAGLFTTVYAMGSNFGDFDNDGYLDMFLGTGNPDFSSIIPNKMFRNVDGKKFEDVTMAARVGSLQKGHAVAFGDMDNDGDEDIYIDMGGAFSGDAYRSSFFLNPGEANNNWISIQLEGTKCNRAAIGTSVKLTVTEKGKTRTIYRMVNSGGSFGSSPLIREIGLGTAAKIDEIEIRWTGSETVQTFKNIASNQFIKIKEGENIVTLSRKTISFERASNDIIDCPPATEVKKTKEHGTH